MIAAYALAFLFIFIRVVGIGTLTAVLHHAITGNDGASGLILAASWIFIVVLAVRMISHVVSHREAPDLTNYGTPTSRLFWAGLASMAGAFSMASHGGISSLVMYAWSIMFMASLLYIVLVDQHWVSAHIRALDWLLGITAIRHSPHAISSSPSQPANPSPRRKP